MKPQKFPNNDLNAAGFDGTYLKRGVRDFFLRVAALSLEHCARWLFEGPLPMTIEIDGLREALFAQMRLPPLPEYSGNTVILRACKSLAETRASPTVGQHEPDFKTI